MAGVTQQIDALSGAPGELRDRLSLLLADTARSIHADGLANIEAMTVERTGRLKRLYRYRLFRRRSGFLSARIGYVDRRSQRAVYYARFVHDGTVRAAARPFHDLAVEAHAGAFHRRARQALTLTLRRLRLSELPGDEVKRDALDELLVRGGLFGRAADEERRFPGGFL